MRGLVQAADVVREADSLRLQNVNGASGNVYWTPVTLSQGSFPNDWFYGINISANDLINQILSGPPFSGECMPLVR